jgi:hypothetical protein
MLLLLVHDFLLTLQFILFFAVTVAIVHAVVTSYYCNYCYCGMPMLYFFMQLVSLMLQCSLCCSYYSTFLTGFAIVVVVVAISVVVDTSCAHIANVAAAADGVGARSLVVSESIVVVPLIALKPTYAQTCNITICLLLTSQI